MIEAIVEKMRGIKIKGQPHASRGGRAYPKEVREMVIEMMLSGGIAAVKSQVVKQLRAQKKFPVLQTCRRWLRQHLMCGNVLPKRKTGNKVATREIMGEALVQLALYRVVRPHARLYEVRAYLANRFPLQFADLSSRTAARSLPKSCIIDITRGILTQKSDET